MKNVDTFLPDQQYHIYNHAVGSELLFRSRDNYKYFLKKYAHYMNPVAKTISYCLMPNHFHLFVQFHTADEICALAKERKPDLDLDILTFDFHKFLMQQLSNCLNCYAKSYNKKYGRRGALFLDYTRRIFVDSDDYFRNLIYYIHYNPVRHGFCALPADWEFSSYRAFTADDKIPNFDCSELLTWFEGKESFIAYHEALRDEIPEHIIIESGLPLLPTL